MNNNIWLPDIVGKGYKDYWHFKGRFRVCKGSRASKKSKTTALNFIWRLIKYPESNLLVVRKTYRTLKDSCFTELKWAINRLNLNAYFECKVSPLEIIYTNPETKAQQRIYFRGLDDPFKITSITVSEGVLCWLWIEEAYEISNEEEFDVLQESIRGEAPKGIFKQITLTFNPWNEHHWIKKRFFDIERDPDILAITTNYKINEWLDESDIKMFEDMAKNNPRRYQVAGLGQWGIADGLVYENFNIEEFNITRILEDYKIEFIFGLDFGYVHDPTALFCGAVNFIKKQIYVFDELYETGLINSDILIKVKEKGYLKKTIIADSSEPKSIQELRLMGMDKIQPARKGRDSVMNGIQYIQNFKIIIHPNCVNFIKEINNYMWDKDKITGKSINRPIDENNHLLDAMRYAMEKFFINVDYQFY